MMFSVHVISTVDKAFYLSGKDPDEEGWSLKLNLGVAGGLNGWCDHQRSRQLARSGFPISQHPQALGGLTLTWSHPIKANLQSSEVPIQKSPVNMSSRRAALPRPKVRGHVSQWRPSKERSPSLPTINSYECTHLTTQFENMQSRMY